MRFREKPFVSLVALSLFLLLAVFISRATPLFLSALGPLEGPISAFFVFMGIFASLLAISFGATYAMMRLDEAHHDQLVRQRRRELELLRDHYFFYVHRRHMLLHIWLESSLTFKPKGPHNSHDDGGTKRHKGYG